MKRGNNSWNHQRNTEMRILLYWYQLSCVSGKVSQLGNVTISSKLTITRQSPTDTDDILVVGLVDDGGQAYIVAIQVSSVTLSCLPAYPLIVWVSYYLLICLHACMTACLPDFLSTPNISLPAFLPACLIVCMLEALLLGCLPACFFVSQSSCLHVSVSPVFKCIIDHPSRLSNPSNRSHSAVSQPSVFWPPRSVSPAMTRPIGRSKVK